MEGTSKAYSGFSFLKILKGPPGEIIKSSGQHLNIWKWEQKNDSFDQQELENTIINEIENMS